VKYPSRLLEVIGNGAVQ